MSTNINGNNNNNMNSEAARLATFHRWAKDFISKEKLALYGFYNCGPGDIVKCAFCLVEIGAWERGDNALREHLRWSPNCPLIKRKRTFNQPIDNLLFERSIPPVSSDNVGIRYPIEPRPNSYSENQFLETQCHTSPDYRNMGERLKSFKEWPKFIRQTPKELSEAGFFYLGLGDQVKCFCCGGGLRDWNEADIPWEQHALWYDKCIYLKQIKSSDYIEMVKQKFDESQQPLETTTIPPTETITPAAETSTELTNEKMCKICFDNEMNAILTPCMHIIACVPCAFALDSCPICRKSIDEVKRIYFS